ncbi:MAG: ROK family protein [Verrucomicrobiota bacterium]
MDSVYLGVDVGGTNILAAVVDDAGTVLGSGKGDVKVGEGVEEVANQMVALSEKAMRKSGVDWASISALGIAVPSAIDPESGLLLHAPNLGWQNVQAREIIEQRFGRAVVLENDVNCGVWGEYAAGAGRGFSNVAGFFVGTGLGGGLILNGGLHLGTHGMAAEFGHEVVRYKGRKCGCGKRGCLEAYCSKTAFCRQFEKQINRKGKKSVLSREMKSFDRIKSSTLKKAYDSGDAVTRKVVHKGMKMLGVASANLVAAVGPQCIVYGGGVMESMGEELLPIIVGSAHEHLFGLQPEDVELRLSALGDDSVPVGAALLARDRRKAEDHE